MDRSTAFEDRRTTFSENYLQQTKHIKDPWEDLTRQAKETENLQDLMERHVRTDLGSSRYRLGVCDPAEESIDAGSALSLTNFYRSKHGGRRAICSRRLEKESSKLHHPMGKLPGKKRSEHLRRISFNTGHSTTDAAAEIANKHEMIKAQKMYRKASRNQNKRQAEAAKKGDASEND
ncbi:hypothetical protein Tco_0264493 [Tanacetum coccineum]